MRFFLLLTLVTCFSYAEKTKPISIKKKTETKNADLPHKKHIRVTNNISPEMLSYTHWTGTYSPHFTIYINEKEVPFGKSVFIPKNEPFVVRYNYSFLNGYKTGEDETTYQPTHSSCNISLNNFCWKKKDHLSITNATIASHTKNKQE